VLRSEGGISQGIPSGRELGQRGWSMHRGAFLSNTPTQPAPAVGFSDFIANTYGSCVLDSKPLQAAPLLDCVGVLARRGEEAKVCLPGVVERDRRFPRGARGHALDVGRTRGRAARVWIGSEALPSQVRAAFGGYRGAPPGRLASANSTRCP
jgi:hypothetical protein